ncbi:selenoprotein T2, partial [Lingula anatina]|uniref:Selenoprotein T2 n=1 Tax=Lingula anatina TaxID=7574 RepID=A0A1S3I6F0_LINAN
YQKLYEQFSYAIQQKYPALSVQGGNYPPPPLKATIAQILGLVKIGLIIMIASGFNPFPALGVDTPSAYTWASENKVYACLMLFFICNAVEGQLISTGAFEVTFNDVPIWSKLETGRIPSPQEFFQIIDNNMRMTQEGVMS